MQDDLGDRMKSYEDRARYQLMRRAYTIIRLDGKAFHSFTRGFKRPFDPILINMMDQTAKALCEQIQGCKLAFVQSDEITLVLTDFETPKTSAWFDSNVQKIASISASMATVAFNKEYLKYLLTEKWNTVDPYLRPEDLNEIKNAFFDSRTWSIADYTEVENVLIWRQKDATKNSISMVAQSLYSHKALHSKNSSDKQEMIFLKGQNWNDYPVGQKRGRCVIKTQTNGTATNPKTQEVVEVIRNQWTIVDPPIFTTVEGRDFMRKQIPRLSNLYSEANYGVTNSDQT